MRQPTHILNDDLAMRYAAGALPEAYALAVATHVSLCDEARAKLAGYEALGGCVLSDCETEAVADDALSRCLERLDEKPAVKPKTAPVCKVLPAPLTDYVGGDVNAIKWSRLGGGVRQSILRTSGSATARLLYIPAGQAVPDHGHNGMELTVVLQGAFSDETDRFARGDIEIATEDLDHQPIAEAGADCICLAATDAPLRFNALMPRLLQPLFRI